MSLWDVYKSKKLGINTDPFMDMVLGKEMAGYIDRTPYLIRQTANGKIAATKCKDTIIGGSVVFNQLCNSSSVSVPSGHKYYMIKGGTASIGASSGSAITGLTNGTDVVIDLSQMFGSDVADAIYAMEQAAAGSGVAYFKSLGFNQSYYAYDAGTLKSVEGLTSHDMVEFNAWDGTYEADKIITSKGAVNTYHTAGTEACTDFIKVLPNTTYYMNGYVGSSSGLWSVTFYNSSKAFIGHVADNSTKAFTFTTPSDTEYIRCNCRQTLLSTLCINISSPDNGTYKPYKKNSYELDSTLTLRGIPKWNNGLYYDGDVYASNGKVTRKYGIRAYQSGDESLEDAITDGTNTIYKLTTPTTESANSYQYTQICDPYGTEEYVSTSIVPIGHNTKYKIV